MKIKESLQRENFHSYQKEQKNPTNKKPQKKQNKKPKTKPLNKQTQPSSAVTSLPKFSLHLYFEDIFALKEIILM